MNRNYTFKKVSRKMRMGLIVCMLLLCGIFAPREALAQIAGSGTATNPYLISSVPNYQTFQDYVLAENTTYISADKYWKLTTDLNLTGVSWSVRIGSSAYAFKGIFDGDGHTIRFNTINEVFFGEYAGLFSHTYNAEIKNLNVAGGSISAVGFLGGLIGMAEKRIILENVHVTMNNTSNCSIFCGGLIGYLSIDGDNTINIGDCSVTGVAMSLDIFSSGYYAGGLIGYIENTFASNYDCSVNISDCIADVNFTTTGAGNLPGIGGIIGRIDNSRIHVKLTRCFTTAKVPNIGGAGLARGSIVGYVHNNATCTGIYVHNSGSGGVQVGQGTYSNIGAQRRSDWDTGPYIYDYLERRNNDGNLYNSTTRGNEEWGYGTASCPKLTKTEYVVITRKGSNINSITGHQYLSGTNYFTNAGKTLTVSSTLNPNEHQRIVYSFSPEYNHSSGAANNYSATTSDANWQLVPRVNGTVNAAIIEIPYPKSENAIFDQWDKAVTVSWNYSNPNNLTGKFFVYRKENSGTTWTNLTGTSGIAITNGNGSGVYQDNTVDYKKEYNYCIGFIEGTNPSPPNHPDDIRSADRVKKTISTYSTLTYTVIATGSTTNITVSLTNVDSRLTGSNCTYEIQKSANGGSYVPWLSPQTMTGADSYTSTDTR
jgi:hypothetical protein